MIISEDGTPTTKAGLYWRYEKWIRKLHSGIDSVLGATGAIYAMRRHLARPLPTGTLLDDMLMPLRAFLDGYRIVFVPEARAYDTQADLRGEFRRKVRTQAGVYQLISLCPELFGFRNRMLFDFLSHKIVRLVSPWILLAMLVAAWFLPWPLPLIVTAGACVPVVLGLADPFIGGPALLKKVSAAARTFLVLMWAATCAVSILFVPAESLWKPGAQNDTQRA